MTSAPTPARTRSRARTRRRLLLLGALPVLLALLLAGRLVLVAWADHRAAEAFADGRYADARAAAALNDTPLEQALSSVLARAGVEGAVGWVAPHDTGVAALASGDAGAAVRLLQRSLAAGPPTRYACRVRLDLALAQEAVATREAWTAGLAALAPCLEDDDPRRAATAAVRADVDAVAARLTSLLADSDTETDGDDEGEEDDETEPDERERSDQRLRVELDERVEQGERIRQQYVQRGERNPGQTTPAW
ncbi:hypothetical protein [Nocardioides bruguierae]|uniref:hypothetical protein n=1 Tax=Nocardioides bruguierae TaxID=2945102 RepID=UPI00202258D9|nr:hypothetical protein [Nocardioides bruguierae]MCL8027609.1 hypothetical protein [Nocardioides bruguierae]